MGGGEILFDDPPSPAREHEIDDRTFQTRFSLFFSFSFLFLEGGAERMLLEREKTQNKEEKGLELED